MNQDTVNMIIKTLSNFRSLKADITAAQVITYLTIATKEGGVTNGDIEELLDISQVAASRNLRTFDYGETQRNKGLGLADTMMSRDTQNLKIRVPSPDGVTFIKELEATIGK